MKSHLLILIVYSLISCGLSNTNPENLDIQDIEIFKNTPSWPLAKAVESGNISKIKKEIAKKSSIVNKVDPRFGMTLLEWAVSMRKYEVCEELLKSGADPNIICTYTGTTALYSAVSNGWKEKFPNSDTKYIKLLLNYGADPNIVRQASENNNDFESSWYLISNLMLCAYENFEGAKVLVEGGADINYSRPDGASVITSAFLMDNIKMAHYLIVEKKCEVTKPQYGVHWGYGNPLRGLIDSSKINYPVDYLLDMVYNLGSDKHKMKMEIVEEFKKQGIDYQSKKKNISEHTMEVIKKRFPNSWKEYIEEY